MKRFYHFLAIVGIMLAFATSSCNEKAGQAAQQAAQSSEQAALAAKQAAQAAQQSAETLESLIPKSVSRRPFGSTVGWGALTPNERAEIIAIGKDHPYGGVIRPNPQIKDIEFILYLEGVPAPINNGADRVKQTLLKYSYETDNGEGSNMILVQGHFESIQNLASIPDVLNNNSCCIFYGGCIQEYECSQPLPKAEKCSPCEQKKPKDDCIPCKKDPGPGKKQGDGAVPTTNANGNNRKIVTDW